MALRETAVAFKLVGGVETKLDPKTVPTVRLLDLENGVFAKGGSVKKRFGYEALGKVVEGGSAKYGTARQLGTRGDELLLHTDADGYSYLDATDTWSHVGRVRSAAPSERPIACTGSNQSVPDQAVNGGVRVTAWEDSKGGLWWSAEESGTGRVVASPRQLSATGTRPRCVAVGEVLHVYWAEAALGQLWLAIVNPSTPTVLGTGAALIGDLNLHHPSYDACPTTIDADDPSLLVYANQSNIGWTVAYVHPSGAIGNSGFGLPPPQQWLDAVFGTTATQIACAFSFVGATPYVGVAWDFKNARVLSATDFTASIAYTNAGPTYAISDGATPNCIACAFSQTLSPGGSPRLFVMYDEVPSTTTNARVAGWSLSTTGEIGSTGGLQRSVGIVGRMIGLATGVFGLVAYASQFFGTYFTLELYDTNDGAGGLAFDVVGRHRPETAVGLPARPHLPSLQPDGVSAFDVALPFHEVVADVPGTFHEDGLSLLSLEMLDPEAWQSVELGRCAYLGGANPRQYDGARWAEAGYHYGFDNLVSPVDGGSGNLTSSGVYGWVVVPEEVNGQGEIDRGPTSVPVVHTIGGSNQKVNLQIPTLRLTGRKNVRLGVYRTKANDSSIYFRCASLDPSTAGQVNGYVGNDPTVDTIAFVDNMDDATLGDQEQLYTTGGVLSNDPPPAGRALAVGGQRLFFTDPTNPYAVRFSQQLADGYGAELAAPLVFILPPNGGAVTALAVMDGALVVFKESAIYIVLGPGPDANPADGSPNGFDNPQLVTGDVGCSIASSVAVVPIGTVFQTGKGIYLLGRDRQVTYVGSPVEAYNSQTVRAAITVPDRTHVLFVCDTGRTLLYDYFYRQWSTFSNHLGSGAVVSNGVVHYLRTDGRVFAETVGAYKDDNSSIPLRITTAWIRLQEQIQGFQHVYHAHAIGNRISAHTLQFDYQIDYQNGWNAPVFFDATADDGGAYGAGNYGFGVYGGAPSSPYQWRAHLGQPCQAIRFRFQDVEPTGSFGASYELTEILLTGGVKAPVLRPFPAARSA